MSKRKNTGKRSLKGIPENLKPLAKEGERVRFNGGWLTDSPQDRFLAEWIDKTPGAWSVMKSLLYMTLSGGGGIAFPQPEHDYPDEFTDIESALLEFDD